MSALPVDLGLNTGRPKIPAIPSLNDPAATGLSNSGASDLVETDQVFGNPVKISLPKIALNLGAKPIYRDTRNNQYYLFESAAIATSVINTMTKSLRNVSRNDLIQLTDGYINEKMIREPVQPHIQGKNYLEAVMTCQQFVGEVFMGLDRAIKTAVHITEADLSPPSAKLVAIFSQFEPLTVDEVRDRMLSRSW